MSQGGSKEKSILDMYEKREHDPSSYTTEELSEAWGVAISTVNDKLRKLIKSGDVVTTHKKVKGRLIVSYKSK
jgi:predicted transcriptional regulator